MHLSTAPKRPVLALSFLVRTPPSPYTSGASVVPQPVGGVLNRRSILIGVVFVLAGGVIGGLFGSGSIAVPDRGSDPVQTFSQILSTVQARAAGPVDSKDVIEGAIRGMVRTLDPHTNYLDA